MLTLNGTSYNQVQFNDTEMKRIVLNDRNVWAQEYNLTIKNNDSSIAIPGDYLYWSTSTDPESGINNGKCHYGEVIRTEFLQNGSSLVALPTGTYSVTGDTTINAALHKFNFIGRMGFSRVDGYDDYSDLIICTFDNPYRDSRNTLNKPSAGNLSDHYKLYVQWATWSSSGGLRAGRGTLSSCSQGYISTTDGIYISLMDLQSNDMVEIEILVPRGEQFYLRCTQVIEYSGEYVARKDYSDGQAAEDLDRILYSPWEDGDAVGSTW